MNENRSLVPRFPVFHVPHDGSLHRSRIHMFCIPEEKVMFYHEKMRDKYVAELIPPEYRCGEHKCVRYILARFCWGYMLLSLWR